MPKEEKTGILLETGTNEFEIVEFKIGEVHYGINVAKVREVITRTPITDMPQAHPYIDGIFTLRGKAIPLVNLPRCLNVPTNDPPRNVIVTEINNYDFAFLVNQVNRIHRVSWRNMEPSPEVGDHSRVVGIVKMEDRIILLLDFETIISEITPKINEKLTTVDEAPEDVVASREDVNVVCAEDSPLLRGVLVSTMKQAGYINIKDFINGQEAWDYLHEIIEKEGTIKNKVHLIVSDIEMPQMDGHRLLKQVREDSRFENVPFILFSSLISDELRRKGDKLGASGQITKPEINQLIELIDTLTLGDKGRK